MMCVVNKLELIRWYEDSLDGDSSAIKLPDSLKARVMLRHENLNRVSAQKVETWLGGSRTLDSTVAALCRLDTDVDVAAASTGSKPATC